MLPARPRLSLSPAWGPDDHVPFFPQAANRMPGAPDSSPVVNMLRRLISAYGQNL